VDSFGDPTPMLSINVPLPHAGRSCPTCSDANEAAAADAITAAQLVPVFTVRAAQTLGPEPGNPAAGPRRPRQRGDAHHVDRPEILDGWMEFLARIEPQSFRVPEVRLLIVRHGPTRYAAWRRALRSGSYWCGYKRNLPEQGAFPLL